MSMWGNQGPSPPGFDQPGTASVGELNTTLKIANQNMSQLIQVISAVFPRITGSFVFPNGAGSTSVPQPDIQSSDNIILLPSVGNSTAAGMFGSSKYPYVSSITSGTGFVVSTAAGTATGTATLSYVVMRTI